MPASPSPGLPACAGPVVLVGGCLRMADPVIWSRLVGLSGGPGTSWLVLPTASERPRQMGRRLTKALARHGAQAQVLPVAPRWPGLDAVAAAHDPRWVAAVARAQGVFFSGGAQQRIVETLQPGGRDTPLLMALRALQARGGVLAGTSAGAAIMSRIMFRDAPSVMDVLQGRLRDGVEYMTGLGFVGNDLLVDQHFLQRGRLGRLIPLMLRGGFQHGLGVDERAAVQVQDGQLSVWGRGGAVLVDLSGAECRPPQSEGLAMCVKGARLSYLEPGDRHGLRSGQTLPGPGKRAAACSALAGKDCTALRADPSWDFLGPEGLTQALRALLRGPGREVRARTPSTVELGTSARSGFEFRLRSDARTRAWLSAASPVPEPGETPPAWPGFTLSDVLLDILPVTAAASLGHGVGTVEAA